MNELMISVKGSMSYFYYKTSKKTANDAFESFLYILRKTAINYDNVRFGECVLRDEKGRDIDKMEVK